MTDTRNGLAPGHATARILVVDDLDANRALIARLLAPDGYLVSGAVDGAQALKMVADQQPDLVLLDVMMPGADGFAVCRTPQARSGHASHPRRPDHVAQRIAQPHRGPRGGRRRLRVEAGRRAGAARARPLAAANQALHRRSRLGRIGHRQPRAHHRGARRLHRRPLSAPRALRRRARARDRTASRKISTPCSAAGSSTTSARSASPTRCC